MQISGSALIGQRSSQRSVAGESAFHAIDPVSGAQLEPAFARTSAQDVALACELAAQAFDRYRETSLEQRAALLERIAACIVELGDALIERCVAETGLPRARVEGERGRTVGQLKLFAEVVRAGDFLGLRIDPAQPERKPAPRVDLRMRQIALGPVAVFGASNFPLAFSVAGGDTAAALAAGCPVVVKAHPAHPGTSELVGRAIQQAVRDCALPEGVFSLVFDDGIDAGVALVAHPHIKAVGFTGSRAGGLALMQLAARRPEPIPVYAEMSSINPVLLLPHALAKRAEAIGQAFAASLTLGTGQFCTNPGLILAIDGPDLQRFIDAAAAALETLPATPMLTAGIHGAYERGVERMQGQPGVEQAGAGAASRDACAHAGRSALFVTDAQVFAQQPALHDEIFGPASLVVRCPDAGTLQGIVEQLEGQLTIALHIDDADCDLARALLPTLERRAGRVLVNGFGTGVEVGHAMVHGGPFPATSDGRSTSVGSLAIARFLRPVSYQDMPDALLPAALRDGNPLDLRRSVNGAPG
ncbi:NADP-dependent aldehyde dehydrogenase [Paraburkholderia eburnea]|uniref:NADP-dependent aldehyde dehydrogenase n=1 Tax=Paraburkholderia eburnea TaxID=1189126 RepID=A0A2S4MBN0_9BURK|nr:aldehyde dehydrogenase (NADP(+)) [Paraburkholderia eburnea]POR52114.1 NADP-dependent aldehyde dehydrogenase [Paraburkholderia eburnea]PRZ23005.1 NADP-dependent aldehyde dehydrogenase [Paraburkholderia eburnea]